MQTNGTVMQRCMSSECAHQLQLQPNVSSNAQYSVQYTFVELFVYQNIQKQNVCNGTAFYFTFLFYFSYLFFQLMFSVTHWKIVTACDMSLDGYRNTFICAPNSIAWCANQNSHV